MKALDCPKCGAQLDLDPFATIAKCKYCGTESRVEGEGNARHLIEIATRLEQLNQAVSKSAEAIEAIRVTQLDDHLRAEQSKTAPPKAAFRTESKQHAGNQPAPATWNMRAIGTRLALAFQGLVFGGLSAVCLFVAIDPDSNLGGDSLLILRAVFALTAIPLLIASIWKVLLATLLYGRYLETLRTKIAEKEPKEPNTKQWLAEQLLQANARAERIEAKLSKVTRPTQEFNVGCGCMLALMIMFCACASRCDRPKTQRAAVAPSAGQPFEPRRP